MAFPTIADADTKNGVVTTNSTSWTLTYPTNIAAGDLVLAFVATDGDTTGAGTTWPASWNRVGKLTSSAAASLHVAGLIAAGSESGTFTLTLSVSEQGAWRIFRIPAASWYGSGVPDVTTADSDGNGIAQRSAASASSTPDPPSNALLNWDVEDTLWFAVCGVDTSRTISVYPLADRNTADVSGGAGGATLGVCTTTSAVGVLNPGTFTVSASDDWVAFNTAVRPAAAAADPRVPYRNQMQPLIAQ